MSNWPGLNTPTPEELAALDERVATLLSAMDAVPAFERILLDSDKFAGPIAETVIEPDSYLIPGVSRPRMSGRSPSA